MATEQEKQAYQEAYKAALSNGGSYADAKAAARTAVGIQPAPAAPQATTTQPTSALELRIQEAQKNAVKNATKGRMTNSGTRRQYVDNILAQQNQLRQTIAGSNFNDIQKLMGDYKTAANNWSAASGKQRNLERQNPYEAAMLGMYQNNITEYQRQMEELQKQLERYGITVNGTAVDASRYNQIYFDSIKGNAVDASAEYIPANGLLKYNTTFDVDKYLSHVNAEEMQMYNYLAANDPEKAEVYGQYLDSMVQQRLGGARAEEILDKYTASGRALSRGIEAYKGGLSETYNAAVATLSGRDKKTSAAEYAAEQLRADLASRGDEWWRTAGFDAMQSIGGMTPGLIAGAINPSAGMAVFGATSGMMGYQDKLAEGWSAQDARNYGILVGASEAALGKVLGGIPALGGVEGGVLSKLTKNLDNVYAKIILNRVGEMGSEALEEGLQTLIEPAIVSSLKGTPYDSPELREVLYSAVLGAIASAGFGAPTAVAQTVDASSAYDGRYGVNAQALVDEAKQIKDVGAAVAIKAQARLDKGKSINNATAEKLTTTVNRGRMVDAVEAQITERTENLSPQVARSLANAVVAKSRGEKLTTNQKKLIETNKDIATELAKELNPKKPADWAKRVGMRGADARVYGDRTMVDMAEQIDQAILNSGEYADTRANLMEKGQDVVKYTNDFDKMAGVYGNTTNYDSFEAAWEAAQKQGTTLTETQARAAYDAGKAKLSATEYKPTLKQRGTGAVSFAAVRDGNTQYEAPSEDEARVFKKSARYQYLSELAKRLKVDIVFFKAGAEGINGKYVNGTVYLAVDASPSKYNSAEGYVMMTAAHELTHYIKEASPARYAELKDFVTKHIIDKGKMDGKTLNDLIDAKRIAYYDAGVELSVEGAIEEIVADACEMMLRDNTLAAQLKGENQTLHGMVSKWMKKFLKTVKDAFKTASGSQLEAYHTEAKAMEDVFDELQRIWNLGLTEATQAEATEQGEGESKYSFAGRKAKTADESLYQQALDMEKSGKSSEDIRKQTGWFKGMDGQWRYEIDDSAMQFSRKGFFSNPDVVRFNELNEKFIYGTITEEELAEVQALSKNLKGVRKSPKYLREYIKHDELFKAYPELRDVEVAFDDLEGERAHYNARANKIVVDNRLRTNDEQLKDTIVHEIQHAIQHIEGFSKGTSPAYWQNRIDNGYAEEQKNKAIVEADRKYNELWTTAPEALKNKMREINRAKLAKDWGKVIELEEAIYASEYADEYSAIDDADFERRAARERDYERSASDLYFSTAGEIEARNTTTRRTLTAEQRKNTRPDIDREDVVFVDGAYARDISGGKYAIKYDVSRDYYWAQNNDIISAEQQRVLDEAVERISRGYKGFPTAYNGTRIVDYDDALMFVGGTYEEPVLVKVITFNIYDSTDKEYAKERITYGEEDSANAAKYAFYAVENIHGYGAVIERTVRTYAANAGQARRGARGNGGRNRKTPSIRESIEAQGYKFDPALDDYVAPDGSLFSERKLSIKDEAMSDRMLLANTLMTAAQNDGERRRLNNYKAQMDKFEDIQQQLNEAELELSRVTRAGDKKAIGEARRKRDGLMQQLIRADSKLVELQATKPLKDLMQRVKEDTKNTVEQRGRDRLEAVKEREAQKRKDAVNKVRSQKNERIAEIRQEEKQKRQAAVAKERAKADKRVAGVIDYYRDMKQRGIDSRSRTAIRKKIKDLHAQMSSRLLNPKENRYIPKPLLKTVAEILDEVNLDSGRSEKLKAKMMELSAEYKKIAQSNEYGFAFEPVVADMIDQLQQMLLNMDDTSIYNMTKAELEMVYNTMKALDHTVRTAVKLVGYESEKNIFELSRSMVNEIERATPINSKWLEKYIDATARADVFFKRLGGYHKDSTWALLGDMLNEAQRKQIQIQMEAAAIFEELMQDEDAFAAMTDYRNLIDIGLENANGEPVLVTKDIALKIYMDTMAEDNARHFMYSGYTVPNLKEYYKGKPSEAFNKGSVRVHGFGARLQDLRYKERHAETEQEAADIQQAIEKLDAEAANWLETVRNSIHDQMGEYELEWVKAAEKFFNSYSQKVLNETTMAVYGFEKATVPYYVPIHTDSAYRQANFESITRDLNLENSGFMKTRLEGARNPMLAEGLVDVVNGQIGKVAKYAAMMPAVRNFQKVYGKSSSGFENSVQNAVRTKFGGDAVKYIENLLTDLTSPRRGEGALGELADKLRGNLAKAALSLNVGSAVEQVTSYPKAAVVVGYKPLIKALKDIKSNPSFDAEVREEIAKWTPLMWQRTRGHIDRDINSLREAQNLQGKAEKKLDFLYNWISVVEGATVGQLWYAAQYYVEDSTDLKRGTDEFMRETAKVFNRIVEQTQASYNTMQRPDILRNPNALVKQMTMFMTERLQNANMIIDAVGTYNAYRKDFDKGVGDVTAQDVKEARDVLVRTSSSLIAGAAASVALKLLANALLYNMKGYRDEEDELTVASVSGQLVENFFESLASTFLWGAEVYDVMHSVVTGDTYYGISLSGVENFTDALNAMVKAAQEPTKESLWKASKTAMTMLGVPVNNANKLINALVYRIKDAAQGNGFWDFESEMKMTEERRTAQMYRAIINGDTKRLAKLFEHYDTEAAADAALAKHIKQLFKDGELSAEEAIGQLQDYASMSKYDAELEIGKLGFELEQGFAYDEIQEKFVAGEITEANAVSFLEDYGDVEDVEKTVTQWRMEKETGLKYAKIKDYLAAEDITKQQAIEYRMKYGGQSEENAEATVAEWLCEIETGIPWDKIEEAYAEGRFSRDTLIDYYMGYGLYTEEHAIEVADKRDFIGGDMRMNDISIPAVESYNEYLVDAGIDEYTYYKAWKARNAITTGAEIDGKNYTRDRLRLMSINELDLQPWQKTLLARAFDISEKNINKYAPWL